MIDSIFKQIGRIDPEKSELRTASFAAIEGIPICGITSRLPKTCS